MKCDIYIKWNISHPSKERKSYWMLQHRMWQPWGNDVKQFSHKKMNIMILLTWVI